MASTSVSRVILAPAPVIFGALTDEAKLGLWRFPAGMSMVIHAFEPRVGGSERISLTYEQSDLEGKTSGATDTYFGTIVRMVPDTLLVEVLEFETDDPALEGAMTLTTTLDVLDEGTLVTISHADLPRGVQPSDNELGTAMSLERLASLVER